MLSGAEVAKHTSRDSCWVVIQGKAYDVTKFLDEHPGGAAILLRFGGMDATEEYDPIHPPGTIDQLPKECHLGPVDSSTLKKPSAEPPKLVAETSQEMALGPDGKPLLERMLNLHDVENAAKIVLKPRPWAYYSSAADDHRTIAWNSAAFHAVRFRPRVLRTISNPSTKTSMLGHDVALPLFVCPAALARLAHPDGEKALLRGATSRKIPYLMSSNASMSVEDVASAMVPGSNLQFQLYINKNLQSSADLLRRVKELGYKAICFTVDAPIGGNRERDARTKFAPITPGDGITAPNMGTNRVEQSGIGEALTGAGLQDLEWSHIQWIKSLTGLPVIVKGIQTAEDAELCVKYGVDAIYLSNHGGRQLEGAPSSIETLLEMRKYCPYVFSKTEVWVDGGFRRGTDILIALCLGARAVGLGRPFMYSLIWGEEGVKKVIDLMEKEIKLGMALLGVSDIKQLGPQFLNTRALERDIFGDYRSPVPRWSRL